MEKKKASKGLIPDLHRKKALESAIRGEYEAISPDLFLNACKDNPGHATLTPYTVAELNDTSRFELWKLNGMELYYGLKKDGESVELIEVISNDTELPGIATGSAILHAIERGVTCLTAFDLNNFLTERYQRYGFLPGALYDFDPHYTEDGDTPWLDESETGPSDRLKQAEKFWRSQGWQPNRKGRFANNYPGVREMYLDATAEERSMARSAYHTSFIKKRIKDLEQAGILNPHELLKDYGFQPIDEMRIKNSKLLSCLVATAGEDHTLEAMVRFDTSEPMIERARMNTMRYKMLRAKKQLEDQ